MTNATFPLYNMDMTKVIAQMEDDKEELEEVVLVALVVMVQQVLLQVLL